MGMETITTIDVIARQIAELRERLETLDRGRSEVEERLRALERAQMGRPSPRRGPR
jgi:prefoldin subunit 5